MGVLTPQHWRLIFIIQSIFITKLSTRLREPFYAAFMRRLVRPAKRGRTCICGQVKEIEAGFDDSA